MAMEAGIKPPGARRSIRPPRPTSVLGLCLVGLILFWLIVNGVKDWSGLYENFLIGLTNGAVYGLIAIGYSLVYGILELINFAHGDVFMLGGMMTSTMIATLALAAGDAWYVLWPGILLCLVVAMVFCGGINAGIERVAYRRLRTAPRLAPLITAIGVSFTLEGAIFLVKGPNHISYPNLLPSGSIQIFGYALGAQNLLIIVLALALMVGLHQFIQRTQIGRAMRATAQD